MKRRFKLVATAGLLLLALNVRADFLTNIFTGVDENNTNAVLGLGQADTNWFIVSVVSTNNPGPVPRMAITVGREFGWNTNIAMPGSQTISVGTNFGGPTNQWDGLSGADYTFRTTFQIDVAAFTNWTLSGQVWADDRVDVSLNGTVIYASGVLYNLPGAAFATSNALLFVDGTNNLDFIVHNSGGFATGLDFVGSVTAVVPEPGTLAMFGLGLAGALGWRRWRASRRR
ncbi:MAG: PEP-CTERM sorting domain-containing protein [Verrucomicrobia bacterium]|nr:PEP-CTERM sorting domain-containing protein [Verrucomicrobiota bacterium]